MKTELTPDEIKRALAPFDLGPRPGAASIQPVEKGTINSNYRVVTDGGTVFLRVNEGKREADVRYEGALLWHLGTRRFPTPQPLRTTAGSPFMTLDRADGARYVTVFPWVPGHELSPSAFTAVHATRLGEALAKLHLAARDFTQRRDGIYTFDRVVARVEVIRARAAELPELAPVLVVLDDEVAFVRANRAPSLPSGTIHGDLFADNVLWSSARESSSASVQLGTRGEGGEGIGAVLDFEQACVGRYAYDLAVTLLAWCFREEVRSPGLASEAGGLVEALGWSLLSGYQRQRPLSDEEREALWVEARLAALRFTVTRITDVYLPSLAPGAEPPRPGKDFRDYLARLVHLRASGADAVARIVDDKPPLRAV